MATMEELITNIGKVETNLAKVETRVENLERWQKTQNGHLQRIDEKLDALRDSLKSWLIGALTTSLISLVMLLANLIALRGGR